MEDSYHVFDLHQMRGYPVILRKSCALRGIGAWLAGHMAKRIKALLWISRPLGPARIGFAR